MIFDIENWLWKSDLALFDTSPLQQFAKFDYNWFLAKTLSNFVSLPWKLHNRYAILCSVHVKLRDKTQFEYVSF